MATANNASLARPQNAHECSVDELGVQLAKALERYQQIRESSDAEKQQRIVIILGWIREDLNIALRRESGDDEELMAEDGRFADVRKQVTDILFPAAKERVRSPRVDRRYQARMAHIKSPWGRAV